MSLPVFFSYRCRLIKNLVRGVGQELLLPKGEGGTIFKATTLDTPIWFHIGLCIYTKILYHIYLLGIYQNTYVYIWFYLMQECEFLSSSFLVHVGRSILLGGS